MDTNIVIVLVASAIILVVAVIAAVLITSKVTTSRLKNNAESTIGNAEEKAREIIVSGKAKKQLKEFIEETNK